MQFFINRIFMTMAVLSLAFFVGCGSGSSTSTPDTDAAGEDHDAHEHDEHEHGETGPHGGHLIELGRSHEYHAELVEDDSKQTVSVYILDKDMKELAIGEAAISLTLTVGDKTQTYEMAAAGEGETRSEFASADKSLFESFEHHGEISGKLRVTINGTPYVGAIDHHEHDHDDHDEHAHDHK